MLIDFLEAYYSGSWQCYRKFPSMLMRSVANLIYKIVRDTINSIYDDIVVL